MTKTTPDCPHCKDGWIPGRGSCWHCDDNPERVILGHARRGTMDVNEANEALDELERPDCHESYDTSSETLSVLHVLEAKSVLAHRRELEREAEAIQRQILKRESRPFKAEVLLVDGLTSLQLRLRDIDQRLGRLGVAA